MEEVVAFQRDELAGAEETAREYARERDKLAGELRRQKEHAEEFQRAHRRLAVELEQVDAQLREARARATEAEARVDRRGAQLVALGVEKLNVDVALQQALDRLAARRGDPEALKRLECRSGGRLESVGVHQGLRGAGTLRGECPGFPAPLSGPLPLP